MNADMVSTAAKLQQVDPNYQETGKIWPMLLAKYSIDEKKVNNPSYNSIYRRMV